MKREEFMAKNKKFESEAYTITITSKNIDVTPAIENYILGKLSKIERFAPHILDIHVTLDVQKVAKTVSFLMKFLHFKIKVQGRTEDLYSAIDQGSDKLIKLIQKYKTKLQKHRVKEPPTRMEVSVLEPVSELDEINDQIDEENLKKEERLFRVHEIVATDSMPVKMLAQDEAAMKLELSGDNFLVYKSEEDQKLKLMYVRKDDKLGLVPLEV